MIPDDLGRVFPPRRHLEVVPDPVPLELPLAPALTFVDVSTLVEQLLADGFVDGSPPARFAAAVDEGVCGVLHCGACRREGLEYRPFINRRMQADGLPGSYRPVAVCGVCGIGAEF